MVRVSWLRCEDGLPFRILEGDEVPAPDRRFFIFARLVRLEDDDEDGRLLLPPSNASMNGSSRRPEAEVVEELRLGVANADCMAPKTADPLDLVRRGVRVASRVRALSDLLDNDDTEGCGEVKIAPKLS